MDELCRAYPAFGRILHLNPESLVEEGVFKWHFGNAYEWIYSHPPQPCQEAQVDLEHPQDPEENRRPIISLRLY